MSGQWSGGKGDAPRPTLVSNEEYRLRLDYAYGDITIEEFDRRLKEIRQNENKK